MVGSLPDGWQEPLQISGRIVGPVLLDDGIAQDVVDDTSSG